MKKFLKILAGILLVLGTVLMGYIWYLDEDLPRGKKGPEADALAQTMMNALNHEAYLQTRFLEWSYRNGANQYQWDKLAGKATVKWDDYEIRLNLNHLEQSEVLKKNTLVTTGEKEEFINQAVKNFNNDSFWLVAPYKIFDTGTERAIVPLKDGRQGLMVTYASGGTTPGDSYLWILNADGFPTAYKMWAQIIPVGGLEASWDDWVITKSGAYLPKSHKFGPITLSMGDVKGYQ